jgi:hypothetical protein
MVNRSDDQGWQSLPGLMEPSAHRMIQFRNIQLLEKGLVSPILLVSYLAHSKGLKGLRELWKTPAQRCSYSAGLE